MSKMSELDDFVNKPGEYKIVESEVIKGQYRVVSPTAEESSLYSYEQCEEIIRLAQNKQLKGSFDI
jgi:hypothetical protein